ncbi:MAG: FAD-dependent oxidoreductase [Deltaproteobacteria bacterium]|nr:FAD-dependent oxidoreductase [Deltaproteobacteria bacterium]
MTRWRSAPGVVHRRTGVERGAIRAIRAAVLPRTADFAIIGGGVVGLTVALELRARRPDASIVVLEKEARLGEHASGRNSGVLHAGFYYTADSLKARLCREGNRRLTEWCLEHGLPILRCGKLVVARSDEEQARLDLLLERGRASEVALDVISEQEAKRIEPRVRTCGRALFSPTTSSVDPRAVMAELGHQAQGAGVQLAMGAAWVGRSQRVLRTSAGELEAGFVVNAAGLQADRIARAYGFAERYRILPFRGTYLYGEGAAGPLRVHVYPVPDLQMPFLGVHFTVTVDGHVKIGPTALPALWLENYGTLGARRSYGSEGDAPNPGAEGLWWRFSAREALGVAWHGTRLLGKSGRFRRLALRELGKTSRRRLVAHAAELLEGVRPEHFRRWGPPGIRAQLLDLKRGELVMDFCFEGDERSLHVLNAVSPAFTCAMPFAALLADEIERLAR